MSDEFSLFDDEPVTQPEPARAPLLIPDWQVAMLREALERRGVTSIAERRKIIESAVGRPVESLRALTHDEGLRVLSILVRTPTGIASGGSAWDDRDEDTWIDRL
ncbi:hypothetical protein [Nocardioides dongkuii]|uniref:hypothetical protein n=1 Tax=Nocardioides dongkuii TaxID=2760089 RepID=UPI0015FB30BA|nr:hypothetical protein [Nocardioides dongkuii]